MCKHMGLEKVFYILDPASGALTSLEEMGKDHALLEEVVLLPGSLSGALSAPL